MKINLKNICYPKPILSELVDDYKNNKFKINIENQEYDDFVKTIEPLNFDNYCIAKMLKIKE